MQKRGMMEQHCGLTAETEKVRLTRQDFDQVVEAQGRVEGRMERVETVLERLAESQTRTEATMQQLAQAQTRTEERIGRLEEGQVALQKGQVAMQAAIQEIFQAQAQASRELGSLREDVGFGLEDVPRLLLPPYLHKHYGIHLKGALGSELQRRFFPMKDRPADEIDLCGEERRILLVVSYQR